jgi:DNA (cytosine-5)-methyltransferase 1
VVDLFAGGGGTSLGIEWALGRSPDIAINHDPEAVAMHAANHPTTKHYTEDVRRVDIRKVVAGRRVSVLWLSPDCKHHSKAKGGKPVDRKIRGLAWEAVRWAEQAKPDVICLENVQEFRDWGPLTKEQRPNRLLKGFTYRRFKSRLKKLGYVVEDRLLRACDFGAPTTRERLFLVARCDGRPIVWPASTHSKTGAGGLKPWRTAAECIEFSLPCHSIFLTPEQARDLNVRRPLAEKTQRRIYRGIDRFVIRSPRPFIVRYNNDESVRGQQTEQPLTTLDASNRFGLVAPTIVPVSHGGDLRTHSAEEPLRTITGAHRGEHAVVASVLAGVGGRKGLSPETPVDRPYHTITSKADTALVAPVLVPRYGERDGQAPRALVVDQPLPTIVPTQNGASLVAAHLVKNYGGHEATGSQLPLPIDTITGRDHHALAATSLVKLKGTSRDGLPVDEPLHTIQAGGYHYAEVRAFLTRYNGTSTGQQLDLPASTIDATDRLGLVMVEGVPHAIVDIGLRMLIARELYRCQGFPDSYIVDVVCDRIVRGKTVRGRLPADAQVRMCGNSVPPQLSCAVVAANVPQAEERVA